MYKEPYISCWAVLFLFVIATEGLQCPYQECYCAGPDIGCDDRSLHAIPTLLVKNNTFFDSVFFDVHYRNTIDDAIDMIIQEFKKESYFGKVITSDDNLITTVPSGSLPPNLREISLESNPITSIDVTAFDGSANTLESLDFNEANFSKLPDAFKRLRTLRYLSVVNSRVADWNQGAMENIGATVQTLTLENVGFTGWPMWIQYFTQVTQLSVTTSSISSIPDDGLSRLSNTLERLTLNNNKLTEVPKTLSNMTALRTLTMDNNHIVNVTWLPSTSTLTFLSLASNNLADGDMVSSAVNSYAGSLTVLHLSDNKLTYIPDFSFLTRVLQFNFTKNQLFDPFSGTLSPYVNNIDLGHNAFSLIPRLFLSLNSVSDLAMPFNMVSILDEMHIPPWTNSLDLNFNLITELTDTSFPANSSLQFVRLNNNPISTISSQTFTDLPRLVELDLQNTKLTRLPLGLGLLKGFVSIDVSGSKDLVCTCEEKSLRSWIISQTAENIVGDCGETSVYDFFQYLSEGCP